MDEMLNEVKKFYDDRIKSPLFVSALTVWIFTNRVLIFGVLNFSEDVSTGVRIDWAITQIREYNMFGVFTGFLGSIIYSLLAGVVGMVLYITAKNGARALYKFIDLKTMRMVYEVKPNDFVHIDQRDSATTRYKEVEMELDKITQKLIKSESELSSSKARADKYKEEYELKKALADQYYSVFSSVIFPDRQTQNQIEKLKDIKSPADLFEGNWKLLILKSSSELKEIHFKLNENGQSVLVPHQYQYYFKIMSITDDVYTLKVTEKEQNLSTEHFLRLRYFGSSLYVGKWDVYPCFCLKKE